MFRFRDYSIAKKLTSMNLLVSGTAVLLAGATFVAYELIAFRETLVANLSIQAQIVGSNSIAALLFNDSGSAEKTLSALQAAPISSTPASTPRTDSSLPPIGVIRSTRKLPCIPFRRHRRKFTGSKTDRLR